ncbi:hypothetical protein DE146DRAFT_471294 [Phaeosphaeria sp. MPI-PUGE-AT-0046c]|nr:hypothetical protein DE146DRAFT_471294 [Phaeosphaeria sp. MPI-PUGE-AT-0046c]
MSTAHTCFRSALNQAFRTSNRGNAASCTVASFLVPALAQTAKRSSSCAVRPSKETPSSPGTSNATKNNGPTYRIPPKPTPQRPNSHIPLPPADARHDVQQWLAVVERVLPTNLRQEHTQNTRESLSVTSLDLAVVINAAQDASVDILSHIGLVEKRWPAVVWMAKKLIEYGPRPGGPNAHLDSASNILWPETERRSLKDLTESPCRIERVRPTRKLNLTLEDLTSAPNSIDLRHSAWKRAMGQLWRSLGSAIMASAERYQEQDAGMPYVLEIIAHLHHVGFMPDSVYTYRPHESRYALQQPPLLHMLSSKILTALSDATWKAHETSAKLANITPKPSYFLGYEIPGSRYRLQVTELAPALWLELVLWSCLHGGWTSDGIAILEQVASKREQQGWNLISWREIVLAEHQRAATASKRWSLFSIPDGGPLGAENKVRTHRTLSSEVITAFVDALINEVRVGVGSRGFNPERVIQQLQILKGFLDSNNLSLGSTSWDAVMARLLESGAFVPERRPETLLSLFELATGFGAEINTANTSATVSNEVPYFFEPTTLPLNLLHRTMRAFINNGDIKGAMTTHNFLLQHTDENKQKSLQHFFEMLKSQSPLRDELFTTQLPPVDFPAFETNLPVPLRAKLLDLATESKAYDLGRSFLFAQDIDGPLIGRNLYNHRNVAASIIRFGTLAGENELVLDIVKRAGVYSESQQQHRLPVEVLTALFCSQLKLHKWGSVRSMQDYVAETPGFKPPPVILSTFAAELLRLSNGLEEEVVKAQDAFTGLLYAWEASIMNNIRHELYCILAIMSQLDGAWNSYCSQFLATSSRCSVKLSTENFNALLSGILDRYGSSKSKKIVNAWCHITRDTFNAREAPGGLLRMSRFRLDAGKRYADRPADIEVVQESGAKLVLQGRISPNRQTAWAVIRKVQEEVDPRRWQGRQLPATEGTEAGDTLRWAARLLHNLGYDYEDIVRDMGSDLAKLAGLEAPAAPEEIGSLSGVGPRNVEDAEGLAFL